MSDFPSAGYDNWKQCVPPDPPDPDDDRCVSCGRQRLLDSHLCLRCEGYVEAARRATEEFFAE